MAWEAAFNAISDWVAIIDTDHRILRVNKAFAKNFNKTTAELEGKLFFEVIKNGEELDVESTHRKAMDAGQPAVVEIFESSLGKHLEIAAYPIFDEQGKFYTCVALLKDVTERKKLEQVKSEFINTVSHELRTPLTTIREVVSQFLDGILGAISPEQKDFLSITLEDIDRLTRIISSLLDISKIEAKKVDLRREAVDMAALVKGVAASFSPSFKDRALDIKTSFSCEKIEVYVDRDKIIQVFTNLVGNALKFTEKGSVELRVEDKGEQGVECRVIDTGRGIAEEDIPNVFNKFQQFGRVYGPGEKGTGLGLSIAQGIVELHNGKIRVESQTGAGTKFIFTLPKYTIQEMIHDSVERKIALARKEEKSISVFVFKLDAYDKIEQRYTKEKAREIFSGVCHGLERSVRIGELVMPKGQDEIIILEEIGKQYIACVTARLKKVIKESILEFNEVDEIDFSYCSATFPDDAKDAQGLFEQARLCFVNEKEIRLSKDIVIVDDDPAVLATLRRAFGVFGYKNITEAGDGNELLEKLREGIPDLIVLDMKMPHMNGYEVIGRLKEDVRTKDIPIIIMSGYKVEYDQISEYIKKKAIPVMGKPVDMEQLKKFVNHLL
jgi:two-component system phosphate regulon sensor histidine kinase PhoR